MFGSIGPQEILIVLVIALIVLGPKKLPEMARSLGKGVKEFKEGINDDDTVDVSADEEEDEPVSARVHELPPADLPPAAEAPEPVVAARARSRTGVFRQDPCGRFLDTRGDPPPPAAGARPPARSRRGGDARRAPDRAARSHDRVLRRARGRVRRRVLALPRPLRRSSTRSSRRSSRTSKPITTEIGEAFTLTIMISVYTALLVTFPFLLYQLYSYLIPAFSQDVSKRLRPLLMFIPLLFLAGAAFGYYVVVPSAVRFLYFWASDEVTALPRARSLYPFEMTMMFVMGIIFEMPAAVWVLTRLHILSSRVMKKNRRIAIVVLAAGAAALPGTDPVSMLLELLPLLDPLRGLDLGRARRRARARARTRTPQPPPARREHALLGRLGRAGQRAAARRRRGAGGGRSDRGGGRRRASWPRRIPARAGSICPAACSRRAS